MAAVSGDRATSHGCRYGPDQRTLCVHGSDTLGAGWPTAIEPNADLAVQRVVLRFCSVRFGVVGPLAPSAPSDAAGEPFADGYPGWYSNPRNVLSRASGA